MALGKRISDPAENNNVGTTQEIARSSSVDNTIFKAETPKYSFDEIILNSTTYDSLQDVLTIYNKRRLIFDEWGLSSTHKQQDKIGINLYGAPGTGKTMVAHAIAKQLGRKLLIVDYSQIESKYVGETSKNIVSMFEYAKATNSIIFFDEADALLSKRVTNMSNSTDVSVNQTRSVLLVMINDFDDMILFATNFIKNYDPAFMRRITAHVKFDLPDEASRIKLWNLYIPDALPTNIDIVEISKKYCNISGADISNAVLNASLRAARIGSPFVEHEFFEDAIKKILDSKDANDDVIITRSTVSEEYVKKQFGGELPK